MKKLLPFLFLACCSIATAQDTIRVCTYNVLNYSVTNEDGRKERFERILKEIKPDLFIVQEMIDSISSHTLGKAFGNAMVETGHGGASWMNFHDGNETDNMLYYNHGKFEPVNAVYHTTGLRDIAQYTVAVKNTNDTLHIFSVHLKAGNTQEDELQRFDEIETMRTKYPGNNANIIVAGDFNFYHNQEPGYQLLDMGPVDMNDPLGFWLRDNTQYAHRYTQSPRTAANAACGGGVGGGMDDRFDFIFHSDALSDNIVLSSYTVFGNDGVDRRNSPINNPPNTKVSAQIADDLACASDHLPVYVDYIFQKPTSIQESDLLKEITFNETHDNITISLPASGTVTIVDILGRTLLKENISGRWSFKKNVLQNGMYFIQVEIQGETRQYKFSAIQ